MPKSTKSNLTKSKSTKPKLAYGPYCDSAEFAAIIHTNESTIRASRVSGVLYGRPAPEFYRIGKERKILYKTEDILAWIEEAPKMRVTDAPEPEHLQESREDV